MGAPEAELGARRWATMDRAAARRRVSLRLKAKSKDDDFYDKIEGQRFQHPETGNKVLFWSLPSAEQKKIRQRYDQGQETGGEGKEQQPSEKKSPSAFSDWLGSMAGDKGSSHRRLTRKLKGLAEKGKLDDAKVTPRGVEVKSLQGLANKAGFEHGTIPHRTYADAMRDAGKWDDDKHRSFMEEQSFESPEAGSRRREDFEKGEKRKEQEAVSLKKKKREEGILHRMKNPPRSREQGEKDRERLTQIDQQRQRLQKRLRSLGPEARKDKERDRLREDLKKLDREEGDVGRTAADGKDPGGDKWKGPFPKGWTDKSRKKFWDSLTSKAPKHKVTECIKKMKDTDITDPGAFCAALADRVIPGWREEAAKERRKKALSQLDKAAKSLEQPLKTRRDYGKLPPKTDEDEKHSILPGADTMSVGDQEKDSPTKLASSPWISLEEMERLCPPCAEKMRKVGFKRVRASVVERMIRDSMR